MTKQRATFPLFKMDLRLGRELRSYDLCQFKNCAPRVCSFPCGPRTGSDSTCLEFDLLDLPVAVCSQDLTYFDVCRGYGIGFSVLWVTWHHAASKGLLSQKQIQSAAAALMLVTLQIAHRYGGCNSAEGWAVPGYHSWAQIAPRWRPPSCCWLHSVHRSVLVVFSSAWWHIFC